MSTTTNYSWRVYGDGGPDNPSCTMVGYFSDSSNIPPQWQETLEGEDKLRAIDIVNEDRAQDEPIGNYSQSTINASQRWYLRTSRRTGNAWEVVLDEDDVPIPDPCSETDDPRNRSFLLANATVALRYSRSGRVTITISGSLPQA